MNAFKLRRFNALVILQCVRWYSKYAISYRQLEEIMAERGVAVDHTTIWRWIQHYAPRPEKQIRADRLDDRLRVLPTRSPASRAVNIDVD
jgi:transposase, IS6 family